MDEARGGNAQTYISMKNAKPKWNNLRRNKCPMCNAGLTHDPIGEIFKCDNIFHCGYVITGMRFKELVGKMNKEAIDTPVYRQGEEVEDLHKVEDPVCSFCHTKHDPAARCSGFGE